MPRLIETKTSEDARRACALPRPFGPGVNSGDVESVEVWGSTFSDPGDDWCEFRMTFADGSKRTVRLDGY